MKRISTQTHKLGIYLNMEDKLSLAKIIKQKQKTGLTLTVNKSIAIL